MSGTRLLHIQEDINRGAAHNIAPELHEVAPSSIVRSAKITESSSSADGTNLYIMSLEVSLILIPCFGGFSYHVSVPGFVLPF